MKSKRTKILVAVLLVVVAVFLASRGFLAYVESNLQALGEMELSQIDLSHTKDGIYSGSYSTFPVSAEVKVAVKGHRIEGIELVKHSNGQGAAAESIPGKVLKSQSLRVDSVSGATYSSKVILKAIENALLSARK